MSKPKYYLKVNLPANFDDLDAEMSYNLKSVSFPLPILYSYWSIVGVNIYNIFT